MQAFEVEVGLVSFNGGHEIIIIWKMYNFHECNLVYKHKYNNKAGFGNVYLLLDFSGLHHNKNFWTMLFSWGKIGRRVKPTTHFHLVLKSKMCGAIPLLLQNTFVA